MQNMAHHTYFSPTIPGQTRSGLVGEAELDTEGRVDVTLELALADEVSRVVGEGLDVLGVEGDGVEVGLDAVGRGGLCEDDAVAGDWAGLAQPGEEERERLHGKKLTVVAQ